MVNITENSVNPETEDSNNLETVDSTYYVSDKYNPLPLKDGINLSKLVDDGTTFEVNTEELYEVKNDEPEDEFYYTGTELLAHNKIADCLGLDDDDEIEGSPFEKLAKKMKNVTPNGLVKKLIKEEGVGDVIPERALVTIHYDGYLEYQDDPYDSTYLNKRTLTFRLSDGKVLLGIDIAVASMKLNEISQFVIEPELGYGKQGCLDRIPKNAKLMYVIKVLEVVDSGAADAYEKYNEEEKKKFENVYRTALALHTQANDLIKYGNVKVAIKRYNTAVNMLEDAHLADMNEQKKQQSLLMKLYSNLSVSYNKDDKPRKACIMCKKVYEITRDKTLKPTPKIFFHHGRALFKLGEYSEAIKKLNVAKNMLPGCLEIADELAKVEAKLELHREQELKFAKLFISKTNTENQEQHENNLSDEFIEKVKEFCVSVKEDTDPIRRYLPHGLNEDEIKCFKKEAANIGLTFQSIQRNDETVYLISKKIEETNKS